MEVQLARDTELLRQIDQIRVWGSMTGDTTEDAIELLEQARERNEAPEVADDFREDYEFYGCEEGVIHYVYKGYCQVCKLSTEFRGEHPFFEIKMVPDAS